MAEYEAGTFRCIRCAKEFLTKGDADRHYNEEHREEVTEVGE